MTPVEAKIIKARQEGPSFCEISSEEVRVQIDQIMLRGAAIYGCALPQTEFFAEFIAKELEAMITQFGYGELTVAEILLALRLNCINNTKYPSGVDAEKILFTGHSFNVNFIVSVLEKYMTLRTLLDRKIQNLIDGFE